MTIRAIPAAFADFSCSSTGVSTMSRWQWLSNTSTGRRSGNGG
ncbi:hypothetical protein [Actinomadura madurae]|nr:hypothetical protein [Actinomadura madurae]